MGTPTVEDWPGFSELPWYELVKPQELIPSRFRSAFQKCVLNAYLLLEVADIFFCLGIFHPPL